MLARRERVADVNASRQWLSQQPWAARDRISLIGWANGASAVLWAVRPQSSARRIEPDFRSAIAFYPDCRISSGLGWSTRVPTLLLIGAQDDVSSPSACRQMVDGARGRSALARIVVYPGAPHDFDRANLPLRAIGSSSDAALARTRPYRHRRGSAQGRATARRRVAGAVTRTSCPDRPAWPRASAPPASLRAVAASARSRRAPWPAADPHPRWRRRGRRRIRSTDARSVRSRRRHGRHGPVRRAPAQSRARARRDRTAPTTTGRYGRRARRAAAARSEARGGRARPAAACARGRARWRCAAPGRWRALRPSA